MVVVLTRIVCVFVCVCALQGSRFEFKIKLHISQIPIKHLKDASAIVLCNIDYIICTTPPASSSQIQNNPNTIPKVIRSTIGWCDRDIWIECQATRRRKPKSRIYRNNARNTEQENKTDTKTKPIVIGSITIIFCCCCCCCSQRY